MSMTSVWVFPGQGSQFKGMGADLFARYPQLVAQADEIVGCSLRRLCLEDPDQLLGQTQYTQPALFVVSALTYLHRREQDGAAAQCFAGHSLGEFNALCAADAYDFATGVALVTKRGELMAHAPKGAMAAVIGLGEDQVRALLARSEFARIDVANVNSASQIVVSGLYDEIERCEALFAGAGARYIRLKVSAAFHSRFMCEVEEQFAAYVAGVPFRPLAAEVISNCTARPYPKTDYQSLLIRQITQPVRWYESMSRLLARGEVALTEIGPGDVLTNLHFKIRQSPMVLREEADTATPRSGKPRTIFMYSGQGSQYYAMGKELYQHNAVFRQAMQDCAGMYRPLTGRDMLAELYDDARRHDDLTDILLSHPALLSIGYALTQVLLDGNVRPDGVLGYSLGEYAAATVAGVLSLEDAMAVVVKQARLVCEHAPGGGMLTILASVHHYERHPDLYAGTTLASVNFAQNFVVSGVQATLAALKRRLDDLSVVSLLLPVTHAFHSSAVDPIESEFKQFVEGIALRAPQLPLYSTTCGGALQQCDAAYFWDVIRGRADFRRPVDAVVEDGECRFVDLGPSGTLAGFIKHGYGGRIPHAPAINQFGRNLQSVSKLFADLAA
ncbi:MAG: ACP S-malonyltransferase [Nevskiaceae bacterium]